MRAIVRIWFKRTPDFGLPNTSFQLPKNLNTEYKAVSVFEYSGEDENLCELLFNRTQNLDVFWHKDGHRSSMVGDLFEIVDVGCPSAGVKIYRVMNIGFDLVYPNIEEQI